MPLDNYGFSAQFGWTNGRFGVSWQLNLELQFALWTLLNLHEY